MLASDVGNYAKMRYGKVETVIDKSLIVYEEYGMTNLWMARGDCYYLNSDWMNTYKFGLNKMSSLNWHLLEYEVNRLLKCTSSPQPSCRRRRHRPWKLPSYSSGTGNDEIMLEMWGHPRIELPWSSDIIHVRTASDTSREYFMWRLYYWQDF